MSSTPVLFSKTPPEVVQCIVEIVQHSRSKFEYDRTKDELFLDRVLPYPYFYPYAYGFFMNTLGNDGDELDLLYITDNVVPHYQDLKVKHEGYIVGGLIMEDEKGLDEKIFVVPKDEYLFWHSQPNSQRQRVLDDIMWFFTNYKNKDVGRWSNIHRLVDESEAVAIYKQSQERLRNHICMTKDTLFSA